MTYEEFIKSKIAVAEMTGFDVDRGSLPTVYKDHQKDSIVWACKGGCRALFEQFGLGKTLIQLGIMREIAKRYIDEQTLIICPLGVKQEFVRDGLKLLGMSVEYVRTNEDVANAGQFCITNYERVRDGIIDVSGFIAVSLDEASILRGFGTKTYQEFLILFKNTRFKFVATATPSPNEFKELIHYAGFLGVMDTGEALTRFFQRNSEKAGELTLYPHKEREFWLWMSSWALFINKPSDLGYSDAGYDLPGLEVRWHCVDIDHMAKIKVDRDGQPVMFHDAARSLPDAAREKRDTIGLRVSKMLEIVKESPDDHFILWHHLEKEREAIEKVLPSAASVYGDLDIETREQSVADFSDGKIQYLATKPELSGSGCNFQRHCHRAIFVGIDAKFNDFIQAIHRIYRFLQSEPVRIDIIYADSEDGIKQILLEKWKRHGELTRQMTAIIQKYGLSVESIRATLRRGSGVEREVTTGQMFTAVHNDCVDETRRMPDASVDMILTSIPFSNHYEYTPNYNDFGHNSDNDAFFRQMDYLTPELLRVLKPGRCAVIHVKDRILFGSVTGTGMPTVDPFSDDTTAHFRKHGFQYFGRITIETDVVRENNQTYRLGWTECCKDGTKMGVGCPEYLLLFRKLPTDTSKGYADFPVRKTKEEYTRARWQIDARAKWNSSGNRLLTDTEIAGYDIKMSGAWFRDRAATWIYDYDAHVQTAEALDDAKKLPSDFETLRVPARSAWVWDDVVRMRTLNLNQAMSGQEKHICPLQFDIVERAIERWTNPGEIVYDPFGGLMTVPFCAVKMGRYGIGCELSGMSYGDGVKYLLAAEEEKNAPTLFDMEEIEK